MDTEKILIVNGITKKYTNFLLDNISFELVKGTITGFVGKNGAGKSTTLKAILGLIKLDSGNIYINVEKNKKTPIGYIGMEKEIYVEEKMEDVARLVQKAWLGHWNNNLYTYYMEQVFNLNPKQKIKELSTGMAMKFWISLELAKEPRLLLLDEPTSGLDPIARKEILSILRRLVSEKKITILFSSHITEDIIKIADDVIFINDGKIVLKDSTESIVKNYVKLDRSEIEKLSQNYRDTIYANAICRENMYLWDNSKFKIPVNNSNVVGLDEVLIAVGGK